MKLKVLFSNTYIWGMLKSLLSTYMPSWKLHHQLYIEIWISCNVICAHCWIVWNETTAQLYKIMCILLQVPLLCMGSSVWQGAVCAHEYLFLDWTKVDSSLLKHLESSQIWSHNVSEALHVVVLYNFTLLSEICGTLFGWKFAKETNFSSEFGLFLKWETPEIV